jgi:hypothetical protein
MHTELLIQVVMDVDAGQEKRNGKYSSRTVLGREPHVALVEYEMYVCLFIFLTWIKIPDG